ncbi:MAG TPA: tetratricopeptide repeat protein, partial [Firmicutes bacterium]|nr:tetratricopeptide repeat protein [Bacillota bacterium]
QKNSYLNLGIALIQMGEVEEAEGVLRTALAFFPMDAHLHYNLAVAIGYQGRYDEAIGEYEKVIELMPQHLQALYNLALLFQDTEPDRAVELWRRYLDLAREIPSEGRYVKEAEVYLQLAISKAVEGE